MKKKYIILVLPLRISYSHNYHGKKRSEREVKGQRRERREKNRIFFTPTDGHTDKTHCSSLTFLFLKVTLTHCHTHLFSCIALCSLPLPSKRHRINFLFHCHNPNPNLDLTMADSAFTLSLFVVLILTGVSSARDLRPSDHGLIFQTLSPVGAAHSTPEMKSFFNSDHSSPTMSSSSSVALPSAINSGDASPPSWWRVDGGDRVGKALTVASLVCGIAGAILLLASGLIYVFKYRKQKQNAASDGNHGDDNNKLQLVVARDP